MSRGGGGVKGSRTCGCPYYRLKVHVQPYRFLSCEDHELGVYFCADYVSLR